MNAETLAIVEEDEIDTQASSEWLSFSLDNVTYAIDILRVREIRTWEEMTRVPHSKSFVLGLINLRGAIVPIVDLRTRFSLASRTPDKETIVLIMSVMTDKGEKNMGIVVDQISDVVNLNDDDIEEASRFDLAISSRFVRGITDVRGAMAVLLDIDEVLDIKDF